MKHKTDYQKHCEKLNKTIKLFNRKWFPFYIRKRSLFRRWIFLIFQTYSIWEKEIEKKKEIYLEVKKQGCYTFIRMTIPLEQDARTKLLKILRISNF